MKDCSGLANGAPRSFIFPPDPYQEGEARFIRDLAVEGRGDEARGRTLATLYLLDWTYSRNMVEYRPTRDPAGWIRMLLDVAGARAGFGPDTRVCMAFGTFVNTLGSIGLPHVASHTFAATVQQMADRLGVCEPLLEPVVARMRVSSVLWYLGQGERRRSSREKHPQGRHLRKALRARLDADWRTSIEVPVASTTQEEVRLLAALPLSFSVATNIIQDALARIDDDLGSVPFAVFYALLTDARRGGRIWRPPDTYVEGSAYSRATFEEALGHRLVASRSRKGRYRRSVALAELGLSALFPSTIAHLDKRLESLPHPMFSMSGSNRDARTPDWYQWATTRQSEIGILHAAYAKNLRNLKDALAEDQSMRRPQKGNVVIWSGSGGEESASALEPR